MAPASSSSVATRSGRYGNFFLQSDFQIKPVTAVDGGLKVKDELKPSFDIVARRQA